MVPYTDVLSSEAHCVPVLIFSNYNTRSSSIATLVLYRIVKDVAIVIHIVERNFCQVRSKVDASRDSLIHIAVLTRNTWSVATNC